MRTHLRLNLGLAMTVAAVTGCVRGTVRSPTPVVVFPFATDSVLIETIAEGVRRYYIHTPSGPWAIHALDVDLAGCYRAVAVKGANGAAGREKTSTLLKNLGATSQVIGGVNADFFALSGFQGVPTGAMISGGRVITGPNSQPVLAIDSTGMPRALVLGVNGTITSGGVQRKIDAWNRPAPSGLAFFDASWGTALDTATSVVEVVTEGRRPSRVIAVDTSRTGASIPPGGAVLIAGRSAPGELREWAFALKPGDTVRVLIDIEPFLPREAVGGRPMLVRDSILAPGIDTEGQASFRARNPRTAVGIAREGQRLILVVVDGRQKPYSDGMTLRELADLMLALGARDAINLDGGGSSAMVYADPGSRALRLANRPSDATGERPVGNALAVVRGCREGR